MWKVLVVMLLGGGGGFMMVVIGGMGDDCDKLVSLKEGSGGCFAPVTTKDTLMQQQQWRLTAGATAAMEGRKVAEYENILLPTK
jgi:hypothetical protein